MEIKKIGISFVLVSLFVAAQSVAAKYCRVPFYTDCVGSLTLGEKPEQDIFSCAGTLKYELEESHNGKCGFLHRSTECHVDIEKRQCFEVVNEVKCSKLD